jgi:DNA-binding transcriptional LysR family regulator
MIKHRTADDRFQMNLDWNLLKIFNQIAQAGGISRAAGFIGRGQPSVSLALRRLEERLGVKLCRRGARGFELTDRGELLADVCASLESLIRKIPLDIANPTEFLHGTLKISLISSLASSIIGGAFGRFRALCPMVELDVDVAPWDVVELRVLRNQADLGLAPARFRRPELNYALLFREGHRCYCGATHPLHGRTSRPEDLTEECFVLTGADEPDELREYRLRYRLGRRVAAQSDHLEEVRRLIVAGIGIGFLPEDFVRHEVARGDLWPVLARRDELAMDIFAISSASNARRRLCEIFLGVLGEQAVRPVAEPAADSMVAPLPATGRARRAPIAHRKPRH